MLTLPGYQITEPPIYESPNSRVYRATREAEAVILKALREDYPAPAKLAQYQREYDILGRLAIDGVVRVYGLEKCGHQPVLVLEDIGGESLEHWLKQDKDLPYPSPLWKRGDRGNTRE